jgi:hypothetical protein
MRWRGLMGAPKNRGKSDAGQKLEFESVWYDTNPSTTKKDITGGNTIDNE